MGTETRQSIHYSELAVSRRLGLSRNWTKKGNMTDARKAGLITVRDDYVCLTK